MAIPSEANSAVTQGRSSLRRFVRRVAVTDTVVILWAVVGAHLLRFGPQPESGPVTSAFDLEYSWVAFVVVILWQGMLRMHGAYDPRILGHGPQEYLAVWRATFHLLAALAIISYLAKLELARGFVLIAFPAGLLALLVARRVWRTWLGGRRARGEYADRVLVVGDPEDVARLIREFRSAPDAGFAVIGACCDDCAEDCTGIEGVPVVGTQDSAAAQAQRLGVDVVAYDASARLGSTGLRRLGWALEGTGIDLVVAPGMTDVAGPRILARPVAGLPLLFVEAPHFSGTRLAMKSTFDIVSAAFLMVLLAPVFLVVAALVKVEDRGPVFFSQRRVGQGGRSFVMKKFRSMHVGSDAQLPPENDADGPLFKLRDDPRVTRIGRFLRRSSLDELPQLWNVLRGEMSLVGPRPPLASEVAAYEQDVHRRLLVKPGLTGLWQVSGRSDLSWEDSVRLDLYYVENWSFTSDLRILWRTLRTLREQRGAY